MIRNFFVSSILTAGICLVAAAPLFADGGAFDKMYGNGVHAFFSSDYAKAHECLSRAMDAESKDPRCFYFRGLAYLKLGREPEAREDFAVAADLEAVDAYKFYNVSKALERVQGKSRMAIEQYRAKARLKAVARAAKLRRARYEELRAAETRVLQQQAEAVPAEAVPVETAKPTDPFSAGPLEEDEAPKAAAKPAAETADPFADAPAKPPVARKGGGILGAIGKAVKSKLPKLGGKDRGPGEAPSKAPPVDEDDPFGADADDPFGDEAPAPKAKEPTPTPTPTPTPKSLPVDADDPFA